MQIHTIDAATAKDWQDKGEAIIIDVREPGEHHARSIPGATILPLRRVKKGLLPEAAGKKIVLHCSSGKRSKTACRKLLEEDAGLQLYSLEGGIGAWTKAGHETHSTGIPILPLEQQAQIVIGIFIALSVALGYTIHPGFLILTVFLGIGLINAGLTGWCGLELLIAQMPWNQRTTK